MTVLGIDLRMAGPLVLAVGYIVFFVLEGMFPLRRRAFGLGRRILTNVVVTLIVFAIGGVLVKPVVTAVMNWSSGRTFGLLYVVDMPPALRFLLGFLLLDLTYYYWHRANHTFMPLWRFHNVHHLDPDMDVSTSFRFHFGEVLLSVIFRILQVGLLGVPLTTYLTYEVVFQLCTMFHHSNVSVPFGLERMMNTVIVTPRMHGIHHSIVHNEMDSNYSVVFRWWDALNGTLRLNVSPRDLEIGVAGYRTEEDNALPEVLALPFKKQKDYWRTPDGRDVHERPGVASDVRSMLA